MLHDRLDEGRDPRVVPATLGNRDHCLGHHVAKPADRPGSAGRTGAAEIGLVADEDGKVRKGLDQGKRPRRVAGTVLHAEDGAGKFLRRSRRMTPWEIGTPVMLGMW